MKTIIINNQFFGSGSDELGKTLMASFLRKLWANNKKPDSIIFYNSGVKLLSKGSDILDALEALNDSDVDILACGTCLNFFKLEEKLMIGRISNMQEIATIMMNSDTVITI